jgi:hypothetical protein
MAGLVPAIHAFVLADALRTWMPGSSPGMTEQVDHTVICVPTSTTRPVGIWKKSVASLALLASPMNR